MDAFAETIGQLSLSATKELAIEESLHAIEEQWRNLNMESISFSFLFSVFLKSSYYFLSHPLTPPPPSIRIDIDIFERV